MKTVSKIDPEKEYENAKTIIEAATKNVLDQNNAKSLGDSVDNLITATRVLMEREERRRGPKKNPPKSNASKRQRRNQERAESKRLPSERFPELEVKEKIVQAQETPKCPCCSGEMKDSGLFDVSEKLEVIPKTYCIVRTKRTKYNCPHCHGAMVNTPAEPSIVPTSNYGDSLIIDVSLSKYSDLIPLERFAEMAYREGLIEGLPPHSLIGLTHQLADFLRPIYDKIKQETLLVLILLADETPHRMLEGDETRNWYLWGFFSQISAFFEIHNTRSGDVVFDFLKDSQAKYLLSDGYAGYSKAIKDIKLVYDRDILGVHCNSHSYRYFEEASITWKAECDPFLERYGRIYELERERKDKRKTMPKDEQLALRKKMLPLFEEMKKLCEEQKKTVMPGSGLEKAVNYFLNHYDGLTLCTGNIDIPLDNNYSERGLRPYVTGRKTWYGTHSKRGAQTAAILFSIIQTCKMNNVNPRAYFSWVVERIHRGQEPLTPYEYLNFLSAQAETL